MLPAPWPLKADAECVLQHAYMRPLGVISILAGIDDERGSLPYPAFRSHAC